MAYRSTNVTPAAIDNASADTLEVLVLASGAVTLTNKVGRRYVELQNLGPYAIWVTIDGDAPVATKARRILPGDSWAVAISHLFTVKAIASTGDQVTGAATIVTQW